MPAISSPTPSPSPPPPDDEIDPSALSESLVPSRTQKEAGTTIVSFDGSLSSQLKLKEDLKEGCGGQLWPAGMVLAKYMLREHRTGLEGKVILELGAGGGLVGLAVAQNYALLSTSSLQPRIYITDQVPMLSLMQENISLNALSHLVTPTILNWGEPVPDLIPEVVDIVLAADCVYFEPAFPLLLATLRDLIIREGRETVCYFCYKKRRKADKKFVGMIRRAFEVNEMGKGWLRDGEEDYSRQGIFLLEIRRKRKQ